MIVYRTKNYLQRIKQYGREDAAEKKLKRIEQQHSVYPPFEVDNPFLKLRIEKLRIIGLEREINKIPVLFVLEVFARGDNEYFKFRRDKQAYYNKASVIIDEIVYSNEFNVLLNNNVGPINYLPDEYQIWLTPPQWQRDTSEVLIFESREWVDSFTRTQILDYWQTYHKILEDICDSAGRSQNTIHVNSIQSPSVQYTQHEGRSVIFSILSTDANKKIIYLFQALDRLVTDKDIDEARNRIKGWESENIVTRLSLDTILPLAARAYPDYITVDKDAWKSIEEQTEANLALSGEEESLLNEILNEPFGLPVFINGRAGSGKSTMLLYAFSAYCDLVKLHAAPGELLYLTRNERLLEQAKQNLRTFLKTHSSKLSQKEKYSNTDIDKVLCCLQPFSQFLMSFLDETDRVKFVSENYVDFRRFKALLSKRPLKMSAEMCWHVIRVYLKGYRIDQYVHDREDAVEPEEYAEFTENERTVSDENYSTIYANIWPWYQKLWDEQGLWDDQDLVRMVLKKKLLDDSFSPKYAAIFCDEAQDLTRVELQAVMVLSLFRAYDFCQLNTIQNLPFAFAGDPFQTINPTGFRWASLSEAFNEEIIGEINRSGRFNVKLKERNLLHNYRSSEPVVHLCNTIQLWRKHLFNLTEIEPQRSWFKTTTTTPLKIILGHSIDTKEMSKYLENTIFIIPCEEGQEHEYLSNDKELKEIFTGSTKADYTNNILSPAAAKGLEFNRIVLYKFGDQMSHNLKEISNKVGTSAALEKGSLLDQEYYFNKLYVAASRAIRDLLIVDTKTGEDNLWKELLAGGKQLADSKKYGVDWVSNISKQITIGFRAELELLNKEEPLEIAVEFEQKGKNQRNPEWMRRAAVFYGRADSHVAADRCIAMSFQYEFKFAEAGEKYEILGDNDNAAEMYWQGSKFDELIHIKDRANISSDKIIIAEYLTNPSVHYEAFLAFISRIATDRVYEYAAVKNQLEKALRKFADHLSALDSTKSGPNNWIALADILIPFSRRGFDGLKTAIGWCQYRAGRVELALLEWDDVNDQKLKETTEYKVAKVNAEGMPRGLLSLKTYGLYNEIIEEWKKVRENPKCRTPDWLVPVADAYEKQGNLREALNLTIDVPNYDPNKYLHLLQSYASSPDRTEFSVYTNKIITKLCNEGRCSEAADVIRQLEKYDKAISLAELNVLQFNVLSYLASSDLDYVDNEISKRSPLIAIAQKVKDRVTSLDDIIVLGAAYEHIGSLIDTLKYYDNYTGDSNAALCEHARLRWIKTKQIQINMLSGKASSQRNEQELYRRCSEWGKQIDLQIDKWPPLTTSKITSQKIHVSSSSAFSQPTTPNQIGPYKYTTQKNKRLIIIEADNSDRFIIDVAQVVIHEQPVNPIDGKGRLKSLGKDGEKTLFLISEDSSHNLTGDNLRITISPSSSTKCRVEIKYKSTLRASIL